MDFTTAILGILFVDLLALVSPGPNFVIVTSAAAGRSRTEATTIAIGIATGTFVWAFSTAVGLTALFEAAPTIGKILRIVGVAYLLYLGVKLVRSTGMQAAETEEESRGAVSKPTNARYTDGHGAISRAFLTGFIVNITNPKSIVYYGSVFAVFLAPGFSPILIAVLVIAITAMAFLWYVMLAFVFSAKAVQRRYVRASKIIDRACGVLLLGLGVKLALDG
ncbi:MAG: LysE family transporter [Pseudomonadota bacterium]